MPWQKLANPRTKYKKRTISLHGCELPVQIEKKQEVEITNISINQFRKTIKSSENAQIFQLHVQNREEEIAELESEIPEVPLQQKYSDVFRGTVPPGLRSQRKVNHHIEVENDQNPPYHLVSIISR